MKESVQIYTGRVVKKHKGFSVKSFEFDRKPPEYPLDQGEIELAADSIISFSLEPGSNKAVFRDLAAVPGSACFDLYGIIEKHRITIPFPREVIKETRSIQEDPAIDDPLLEDYTAKPFITIDYEQSGDLDQALFIEQVKSRYRIYYALADGAFYIKPGTGLFAEALKRGSSYYLPGLTIPMLPAELSEGILSLNPAVDRRAFIFIMDMDGDGEIIGSRCLQGRIHSRAKLTYDGVQSYYDEPRGSGLMDKDFSSVLDLLKTVGEIRIKRAREGNQVHFNRKQARITCSKDGTEFIISMESRNNCSLYNEQISLMCNMVGAEFLVRDKDPDVQGIYRVHQSPGEEALAGLAETLDRILDSHGIDGEQWRWQRREETLADYIDRIHSMERAGRLVDALERQVLISMRRSMFTGVAGEHFALATNPYSRFSSPMREIVGIFIHKEALEKLGVVEAAPVELDKELREKVIAAGNRSKERQRSIEREVIKCAADRLFSSELDPDKNERTRYQATILGVKKTRLYVRLDSPPIELKVYTEDLEALTGRRLEYEHNRLLDRKTGGVVYRPGDEIVLCVAAYRNERWRLVPEA